MSSIIMIASSTSGNTDKACSSNVLWRVLADSDVHGARLAADGGRSGLLRFVWSALIIVNLVLLVTFCKSRIDYYYQYPYATRIDVQYNWAPAPAITICPRTYNNILSTDIDTSYIFYEASDTDFVGYLYFGLSISVLEEDTSNPNVLVLNKDSIRRNESGYSFLQAELEDKSNYIHASDIPVITERINNVSDHFTLAVSEYFPSFLIEYGLLPDHLACTIFYGAAIEDCEEDLRHELTSFGSCLVLDNVNGSAIMFRNQADRSFGIINRIDIYPHDDALKEHLVLLVHDRDERGEYLFGTYEYFFLFEDHKESTLKISGIQTTNNLGFPYSTTQCSQDSVTTCKADCMAAEYQLCKYFFNTDTKAAQNKPLCHKMFNYYDFLEVSRKCVKQCPARCSSTHYRFQEDKKLQYHDTEFLQVLQGVPYEVYSQKPLYEWDALLAEIGGMMGLFIGASVLTAFYFIQHAIIGIKSILLPLLIYFRTKLAFITTRGDSEN